MNYKDELKIKLLQFGIEPTDSILRFIDLETIPLKAKIFELKQSISEHAANKEVLTELEKWIKEEADDFRNSEFSEDKFVAVYLSMCVLGKIQELKNPKTPTT